MLQRIFTSLIPVRLGRWNLFLLIVCCASCSALLFGRLSMSLARDEYVIRITVINETDDFQNIFIFQQEDALGLMFDKVFPLAWQVFPLSGKEEGIERKGIAAYPASQQVGVTRNVDGALAATGKPVLMGLPDLAWDAQGIKLLEVPDHLGIQTIIGKLAGLAAALKGELVIKANAVKGDVFEYSFNQKEGQYLARLSGRNENGSITCHNGSDSLIDVDYYKGLSRLAVWPQLANGDTARFCLKRTICFAYDEGVRPGQIIREKITGENVISVDPAGCSKIEVLLTYDPDAPGKKKKWVISKH